MLASFVAAAIFAAAVSAQTTTVEVPRTIPSGGDITILNYALTLEHLEDTFYRQALEKFDDYAFRRAGYPSWVRNRIQEISKDESTHVAFLTSALGKQATAACTYDFPYSTVDEFLALSRVLEGVGVSAYLGAAGSVSNADYLTAAGAILTVEARHNAVLSEVEGSIGFPAPFDTPLGFNDVYTLAAAFIKTCPSTNPALPFEAFPTLTVRTKNPLAGHTIAVSFNPKGTTAADWKLQILNGLNDFVVPISSRGLAQLPAGLTGRVYLIATNGDTLSDASTLAGPAILDLSPAGVIPSFQKVWAKPAPKWH